MPARRPDQVASVACAPIPRSITLRVWRSASHPDRAVAVPSTACRMASRHRSAGDVGGYGTGQRTGARTSRGAAWRLRQWTEAFPRTAQLVHRPALGLGRPYWLARPHLDLENQIGVVTAQAPGDEQAHLDTCAELWVRQLDITRPLWRLWLLDGLAEGRICDARPASSLPGRWSRGSRLLDPALRP